MIPANFDYLAPSTVDEALAALADGGDEAKVLGGGQSLLPLLRLRMAAPEIVVDIGRIPELRGVSLDGDDTLVIGAMTTHHEVMNNELVNEHAELLALATKTVADPQIRHRGTLGGALAHADPAGDLPAVALALEAEFVIAGPNGRRTVRAQDFFVDYLTTVLEPDELLISIRIPSYSRWVSHYEKFQRTAQAWAIVGVAAVVRLDQGGIEVARIGLTNMGTTPVRAFSMEDTLALKAAGPDNIREAAAYAADDAHPVADGNASVEYRKHLATVLAGRAVRAACGV